MRVFRSVFIPGAVTVALLVACGGSGPGGSGGGGSGFSAKIDGQGWAADAVSIVAEAVPGVPGALIILGSTTAGGGTRGLTISLYNVSGPGNFDLGVSSDVFGGTGSVGEGSGSGGNAQTWITDNIGTAGTLTLTTLSGGRIVGTFSYVAAPGHSNTVGGTRTVTEGQFDLAFKGTLTPVPDNQGSRVAALFGGQQYKAASVNGVLHDHLGGAGLQLSTTIKDHGLSILLSGVSAPGTYALSNTNPARLMTAGHTGGDANHCCWGGGATGGDVGSVTVTSWSSTRVKGTFTATLQPTPGKPATTALVVSNGTFDVGVDP